MAFLGRDGILKLQRSFPEPVLIPPSAIDTNTNRIQVDYDDWFLAEMVTLVHYAGHVSGFLHRDELDRISLHTNRDGALANSNSTRVSLSLVNINHPVILGATLNQAQVTYLGSILPSLEEATAETRFSHWPTYLNALAALKTTSPWKLQGEMRSWSLSRSAPEIDTSALGDKFSSYIKSTISGSGTLDFVINLYSSTNKNDVDPILRLVHLTEYGSHASAKFYLKTSSSRSVCAELNSPVPVNSSIFFNSNILLTTVSVDVKPDDLVYGSADFVCTGPIRLLSE